MLLINWLLQRKKKWIKNKSGKKIRKKNQRFSRFSFCWDPRSPIRDLLLLFYKKKKKGKSFCREFLRFSGGNNFFIFFLKWAGGGGWRVKSQIRFSTNYLFRLFFFFEIFPKTPTFFNTRDAIKESELSKKFRTWSLYLSFYLFVFFFFHFSFMEDWFLNWFLPRKNYFFIAYSKRNMEEMHIKFLYGLRSEHIFFPLRFSLPLYPSGPPPPPPAVSWQVFVSQKFQKSFIIRSHAKLQEFLREFKSYLWIKDWEGGGCVETKRKKGEEEIKLHLVLAPMDSSFVFILRMHLTAFRFLPYSPLPSPPSLYLYLCFSPTPSRVRNRGTFSPGFFFFLYFR